MRITLVFGALGLAVGGVFALALRLVSGRSVVAGLGRTGSGSGRSFALPRRYADYLPTSSGVTHPDWLPLVPVSVGTGLIAGLLVGALVTAARATAVRGRERTTGLRIATGVTVMGLMLGALLSVELHFYGWHSGLDRDAVAQTADFGWYAYSPLTSSARVIGVDGIFYGGGPSTSSWWPLVLTGLVVGVAVGLLAAVLLLLMRRGRVAA